MELHNLFLKTVFYTKLVNQYGVLKGEPKNVLNRMTAYKVYFNRMANKSDFSDGAANFIVLATPQLP